MARPRNKIIQSKLVVLGDMGTGKTSLVLRFIKGQFFDHQEPTIGAAFFTQILSLNEATVKFDIWDTAGQERYHSLAPMYYRDAAAAIVVYDISNRDTFVRAKKWVEEVQRQGNRNIVMALAANKSDLEEEKREVQNEEDDARYRTNPRGGNQQSIYGSSLNIQKLPIRYQCIDNDEVVDDEEEMGDEVDVKNRRNNGIRGGSNDFDDEEDEDDFDDGNDNEDDDNPHPRTNFGGSVGDSERRLKKWKLKSLISSYEFAPCVPASQVDPLAAAAQSSAPQVILWRSEHTDWTETETFVLLDAWGDQFLQHGRKSLRFEEWHEVAEKVSEVSKIERTDAQSGIAWTH